MSQLKEQFKNRNYTYQDFDRAIKAAMDQFKLSKERAISELSLYMCQNGSVEDFKEYINYVIKHQQEEADTPK